LNNIHPRVSHLSDARQSASAINHTLKKTDPLSLSVDQLTLEADRDISVTGNIDITGVYKVATVQVVGARLTGWTADTGTAKRTANATYAAGTTLTFSATYVQAELTALATRLAAVETALQNATQTIKALKDDAMTHGLIGA
jgi:hypothetical protein